MTNKSFFISFIVIILAIVFISSIASRGVPKVVKTNLENIPEEILGYTGTEDFFPESVYKELNADKHIYRHYRSRDGKVVNLYIGYYGTAKGGRTGHNPYGCLPGSGWAIIETGNVEAYPSYYTKGINLNYILSQKGSAYEAILHWYQSYKTTILPTGFQQNIDRFVGRLLYNKNDGAFVRVSVFTGKEGIAEAKDQIKAFSEKILELLPKYWPVEK
ncbi:exosortase C-terminal domain/associated protein EpsI [Thermodesulfobacteriota bacterium]